MRDLIALLVDHGVLIVFLVTLAARIGVPVPASPLLVVAGGMVVADRMSLAATVAASVLANVLGDGAWFQAGRRWGHRVMRLLCRISLSPDSCVRQSESLIARWGGSSLVAAKFLPGISVVAAPMAGALAMPVPRFLAYAVVAGAIWTGLYLALGAVFSDQIQRVLDIMADTGTVAGVVLLAVLAVLLALRWWRRRGALRDAAMARITADELRELIAGGHEPVIVDVRSAAGTQIDQRRLPGAIALPLEEIERRAVTLLPRDRDIVLYCSCPNEVSAARAARLLADLGFHRARALAGGLDGWMAGAAAR
ncbi:MAG: rhodanese-like domain-containing protein [Betaproteobacteria bacterium]